MPPHNLIRSFVIGAAFAVAACSPAAAPPAATQPATEAPRTSAPSPTPIPTATASPSPTPTAASVRYVAIGASDTVGVGASDPAHGSWPARVATRLPAGATYANLGVSGSLASQASREQLPSAIAQRPTLVTIWLAVNDLNATVETAAYAQALGEIVDGLLQRTDATIFVGNVPDLRVVPVYAQVDKTVLLARVTAYNQVIAQVAARNARRVLVVDLFTGSAELVSSATVAQDGFHPSDAGYQLIADRFVAAMKAGGVTLQS